MEAAAHEQAAAHFEWALEALDPSEDRERCELLVRLGEARAAAGETERAGEAFASVLSVARRLKLAHEFARGAIGLMGPKFAGSYHIGNVGTDLVAAHQEALELLGPAPSLERLDILENLWELYRAGIEPEPRKVAARDALATADALGEQVAARRFFILGMEQSQRRRFEEGLESELEALRLCSEADPPAFELHVRLMTLLNARRPSDGGLLREYQRRARELGSRQHLVWAEKLIPGGEAVSQGDFETGEYLFAQAIEAAAELNLAFLRIQAGTHRTQMDTFLGHWERIEAFSAPHRAGDTRGEALVWLDAHGLRPEQAAEGFQRLADRGFEFPDDHGVPEAYAAAAEACYLLGERRHAAALYEKLLPFAGFYWRPVTIVFGSYERPLACLATLMERWEEAEEHFENAVAAEELVSYRPALAWTRAYYAEMLQKRNGSRDGRRVRELARRALEEAEAMGMRPLVERVSALIGRERYPDGLTKREVEVLRLITMGKSNRVIAEELVLSINTVERHVSHIYNKTGAESRVELVNYANAHGLV